MNELNLVGSGLRTCK